MRVDETASQGKEQITALAGSVLRHHSVYIVSLNLQGNLGGEHHPYFTSERMGLTELG